MRNLLLLMVLGCFLPEVHAQESAGVSGAVAAPDMPVGIVCKNPVPVELRTKDAQRFKADLLAVDATGFDYEIKSSPKADGRKGRMAWPLLAAAEADKVLKTACDARNPESLLLAARILQGLSGGGKEAAKWYALAQKAGAAEDRLEAMRKGKSPFPPPLVPRRAALFPAGGNPQAWPAETGGSMRAALADAAGLVGKTLATAKLRMKCDQNALFLLYSDLPDKETKKWARRFQGIYEGMAAAFIGPNARGGSIWHGKAVVLLFKSRDEYARYHQVASNYDVGASAGLCVSRSDGLVEISMFVGEGKDDALTEYVLYHEFAHGFVHRYQSPVPVASWINEGLAEYMAMRFTGVNHGGSPGTLQAVAALRKQGSFEDFFAAKQIQGKHYGVAGDITRMLVECDPLRYGAFLAWLKRGVEPEAALLKSYGVTLDELVAAYARRIGADQLKSH